MIRQFGVITLLILFIQTAYSQSILDSIGISPSKSLLPNDKISLILNYCNQNILENPDRVFQVLVETKKYFEENKKLSRWGEYSYWVGKYYFLIENYDSALVYYKKTISDIKPNSLEITVESLVRISYIESKNGNFGAANEYLNKIIYKIPTSADPKIQGMMFQQQGCLSVLEENYTNASNYFQKAIEKYRLSGDTLKIGSVFGEISIMYSKIGNFPLALDYLDNAEKLYKKANRSRFIAENYLQKGKIYMNSAKYTEALSNFNLAEKQFETLNDKRKLCRVYNEKGKAYEKLDQLDKSLIVLNEALELAELLNNNEYITEILINIGDLYSKKGEINLGQEYYHKSLALIENVDLRLELYEKLSINYSILLDYKKAYKYQVLYNALNQDLINKKTEVQLALLQNKFENEIEDIENQKQFIQQELSILLDGKKQKNTLYILLIGLQTAAFLILLILFLRNRKQNKQIITNLRNTFRIQRNTLGKNKLDYDKLKKTSERIFNITTKNMWEPYWVLEKISNQLISESEDKKVNSTSANFDNDQLIMARNLLENVLHWAKLQQGLLEFHPKIYKLNDILTPIIKTQKLRAEVKDIVINYTPQYNLVIYSDRITTEVAIRNIIENAIKFSTLEGIINISITGNSNYVELNITDNGVGMTKDQIKALFSIRKPYMASGTHGEKGVGLGLSLTKEFIEKNSGKLKIESSIALGTSVTIILPSSSST